MNKIKHIKKYYRNKDLKLMARTFAISACTAAVVTVIIVCNADRIAHTLKGAKSSMKKNIKTSSDYIKDKISQVAETGDEKIESIKRKVNNFKKEVVEGFNKTDDMDEDVNNSLTIELQQGISNVTDEVDSLIDELQADL